MPNLTTTELAGWESFLQLASGPLPSHAACPLLDYRGGLLTPGECRAACDTFPGCDAVDHREVELGTACRLLRCGEARPLATALGGASIFARRRCAELQGRCPWPRCSVFNGGCVPSARHDVAPPRRIHVLSMGRVGSTFILNQFESIGLKILFEPFNGAIEGSALLHDAQLGRRLRCVYECQCHKRRGKAHARVARPAAARPPQVGWLWRLLGWGSSSAAEALRSRGGRSGGFAGDAARLARSDSSPMLGRAALIPSSVMCHERTVAIKTTRVLDLATVSRSLPLSTLHETRFILLLRDPRAVWASLRVFKSWAIRSIPFVCGALYKQLATAPALAAKAPVLSLFYEVWSQSPKAMLCALARYAGFAALPTAWRGTTREIHSRSLGAWTRKVPAAELAELEADRTCQAYMDSAGYRLSYGAPGGGNGTDYSALDPALFAPGPELEALLPRHVKGCYAD